MSIMLHASGSTEGLGVMSIFTCLLFGAEARPQDQERASSGRAGDMPCERAWSDEGRAKNDVQPRFPPAPSHRKRTDDGMDRITARSDVGPSHLPSTGTVKRVARPRRSSSSRVPMTPDAMRPRCRGFGSTVACEEAKRMTPGPFVLRNNFQRL